jgi:hypothetical protein
LGLDRRKREKDLGLLEYIQGADAAKIEKDKATASKAQAVVVPSASDAILEGQDKSPESEKTDPGDSIGSEGKVCSNGADLKTETSDSIGSGG